MLGISKYGTIALVGNLVNIIIFETPCQQTTMREKIMLGKVRCPPITLNKLEHIFAGNKLITRSKISECPCSPLNCMFPCTCVPPPKATHAK